MTLSISSKVILIALLFFGCSNSPVVPPSFDGNRAMTYLEKQVSFGPRVPGTKAWLDCRAYLTEFMTTHGMVVDSQKFSFFDPYSSKDVELVNLMASYRGGKENEPALLLVAHWDSRPRTDYPSDPTLADSAIAGANDGASGVAVLMELVNLLEIQAAQSNIDIVLVDGEDWGKSGDSHLYLLGARHFASQGLRERYRFGIVIDLVGDKDQQIYREIYSDRFVKPLNDYIWQSAAALGIVTFVDSTKHTVLDDHLALNSGGIPSIVLIDFDYEYWHTDKDTPDKCSAQSLQNIGKLLAYIMYNPSTWPEL